MSINNCTIKEFVYLVKLHREETPGSPVKNTLNPPKEI